MDKMILMVKGHEIWLEASKIKDKNVELRLFYGHNMATDGRADPTKIAPTVYSPKKEKITPQVKALKESFTLKLMADGAGYYTAVVDMSPETFSNTKKEGFKTGPKSQYKDAVYAGAWHQMAKTVFAVGSNGKYVGEPIHGILDIVPKDAKPKVGNDLEMTVYYEGKEMAAVTTDKNGVARFKITAEGPWMFLARHRDPSKGVPDQYDEAVFVTTLALEAAKK